MPARNKTKTVLTCYYRPKPGGFCKRLFRAIRALLDRGHTVHYLAVVRFPIDHPNCHFHRFPWPETRTSGYLFWAFFHLFAPLQLLLIGFRYHVDRLFAFGHNYALLLQPVRLLRHVPLVVFVRADTIENHRIIGRPDWLIALEHLLEGLAIVGTRMYGVSETLTRKIIKRHRLFTPLETGVLRNDVVCSPGVRKKRAARKIGPPFHLACVGVLEPRKNQRFLLEIIKEIKPEQAQLYLYGTGPDKEILKEQVQRNGLEDRVYFMGWVEAEQIWYNVDLLLMPSLHEGAPNAVLEAMGNGVPVLASDIPEHREILSGESVVALSEPRNWVSVIQRKLANIDRNGDKERPTEGQLAQSLKFKWDDRLISCIILT